MADAYQTIRLVDIALNLHQAHTYNLVMEQLPETSEMSGATMIGRILINASLNAMIGTDADQTIRLVL